MKDNDNLHYKNRDFRKRFFFLFNANHQEKKKWLVKSAFSEKKENFNILWAKEFPKTFSKQANMNIKVHSESFICEKQNSETSYEVF